jgi:hypothetical protein
MAERSPFLNQRAKLWEAPPTRPGLLLPLLSGHAFVKLNSTLALKGVALGCKANMLVVVQALE